ncbi:MAG TPA: AfsR/SARP family transcriptional regulator [Gaiellaceae bacterium]|nr:AfsR/SARP family transcriptional regulator [Gaiellaceae bacterium]
MLEFRILGPLEVLDDDQPVRLGGAKQRATLAILLLHANRVVGVERLADDLYAGAPPVTAVTQVQRQISELRKALGAEAIETRSPGYVLYVEPEHLDLNRFERATYDADQALERGDAQAAAGLLEQGLALWRGAPLADLAYESFARTAIERLDELRLVALEQRFEAELALGRHLAVLSDLEALVWEHPLRERLRGQLMLALYRAGRQADALDVYRKTRELLVGELGIEPSRSLQELERQILRQDETLDVASVKPTAADLDRTLLVAARDTAGIEALLTIAQPLARLAGRALIVAQLVQNENEVGTASAAVNELRASLGAPARTAAFASLEPSRDVVRLAANYNVDLVLLGEELEDQVTAEIAAVLDHCPSDVAILAGQPPIRAWAEGIVVPFGGGENDWAALELGAWLASATHAPLQLVGTKADPRRGLRDASRLLADASLATQLVVGVAAETVLVEPSEDALAEAAQRAAVVVAALPGRWRAEGIGGTRRALLHRSPTLLVHRGARPGALAPSESRTRFSWSLEPP